MRAVFLDYAAVSDGNLNTASVMAAMPDQAFCETTADGFAAD